MSVFGARLGGILNTSEDGGVDEDSQQLSVKVCVCVAWIAGDIPERFGPVRLAHRAASQSTCR